MRALRIAVCLSGTIWVATTEKFRFRRASTTAGPETSVRSLRAEESLTVRTAAVIASGIEEDIVFLLLHLAIVALRFVEQSQAFHQQALRVQLGGLLGGFAFEIHLKVSAAPEQNLEHRGISGERPVGGMGYLPLAEIHIALFLLFGERKQTALA